jgi:tRNA 2-thiouridine synthesizing protein A
VSEHLLDARNLLCPLPVIRVQDRVRDLAAGDVLEVVCSDPGALLDIHAWCRLHGHRVIAAQDNGKEVWISITVTSPSA